MSITCLDKQANIEAFFANCRSSEDRYKKIIELGKNLSPLDESEKSSENLVRGCQSQTYLISILDGDVIRFRAASDALISAGLAALLILAYDGESPETLLLCPPDFLDKLGINASLTPNRANGLHSMHLRMKQDALHLLTQK